MSDQDEREESGAKRAVNRALSFLRRGKRKPRARNPEDAPLGDGMAGKAKEALSGRRRQLDKAIEDSGG